MRFSLTSLVRLIGMLILGSSALAVALARTVPDPAALRVSARPRYYGVNGGVFKKPVERNLVFDAQTGKFRDLGLAAGESLEYATSAPWTDGAGGVEMAGRLTSRSGADLSLVCEGSRLARLSYPARELTRGDDEGPVVAGRPCWVPRAPGRLIFPAGDGLLYTQDVDRAAFGAAESGPPRPLRWDVPSVTGTPLMNDPICPPIPALGGKLIVSLCLPQVRRGVAGYGPWQLWWLTLDESGRAVRDAGRITRDDPSEPGAYDERLPNLTVTPEGRVVLVYLSRKRGRPDWALTALSLAGRPGHPPTADPAAARVVADNCAVTTPPISTDGRFVYAVRKNDAPGAAPRRFEIAPAPGG